MCGFLWGRPSVGLLTLCDFEGGVASFFFPPSLLEWSYSLLSGIINGEGVMRDGKKKSRNVFEFFKKEKLQHPVFPCGPPPQY